MRTLLATLPGNSREAALQLNRACTCVSTDHARLQAALEAGGGLDYVALQHTHPHLFSDTLVFVGQSCLEAMAELVAVVEAVVALPAYQEAALAWAPDLARHDPGHPGVFLGYDFHLAPEGPRLIEINTNAGGGLLNSYLLQAQMRCCDPLAPMLGAPGDGLSVAAEFLAMFATEWRLAGRLQPLQRIAIVDENPAEQYLAPEFELFRQHFISAGWEAIIAAPDELAWDGERLQHASGAVDLVYNRLTDFSLAAPHLAALRQAWLADAVLLTPHPRAHALYADKRNLVLLSDPAWLAALELPSAWQQRLLASIPRTVRVLPELAEQFWQQRRQWFFKPAAGFGSRAAYRGDKLTRRVFEAIIAGDYIAQALVPPTERRLEVAGELRDLKLDLRNYVYQGQVQLIAARLYQGQTTNFRTPGGGFAAVLPVSERPLSATPPGLAAVHVDDDARASLPEGNSP